MDKLFEDIVDNFRAAGAFPPKVTKIDVKYIEVDDIYSQGWIIEPMAKEDHLSNCDCNDPGDFSGGSAGSNDR